MEFEEALALEAMEAQVPKERDFAFAETVDSVEVLRRRRRWPEEMRTL